MVPCPQGAGTKTRVTLADIVVTDVRPEAKGNPFRVLLAPLATSTKSVAGSTAPHARAGGQSNNTFPARQAGGSSSSGFAGIGDSGDEVERGPLITVTATTTGDRGPVDAEMHLASFACNVMVDAIRDALLALVEVNVALLKMLGAIDSGAGGARERGGTGGDPLGMLGSLDTVDEPRSEVRSGVVFLSFTIGVALPSPFRCIYPRFSEGAREWAENLLSHVSAVR